MSRCTNPSYCKGGGWNAFRGAFDRWGKYVSPSWKAQQLTSFCRGSLYIYDNRPAVPPRTPAPSLGYIHHATTVIRRRANALLVAAQSTDEVRFVSLHYAWQVHELTLFGRGKPNILHLWPSVAGCYQKVVESDALSPILSYPTVPRHVSLGLASLPSVEKHQEASHGHYRLSYYLTNIRAYLI
jgi:hypothetical protein